MTKACHFCMMNWANLNQILDDSIDLYYKQPTLVNMAKSAKLGKLVKEYVLAQ